MRHYGRSGGSVVKEEKELRISPRDIPIVITLGDICLNARLAFSIMEAVQNGKYDEIFNIAEQIFNHNNEIANTLVNLKELCEMIDKERQKYN
jgi:hypothetical protein